MLNIVASTNQSSLMGSDILGAAECVKNPSELKEIHGLIDTSVNHFSLLKSEFQQQYKRSSRVVLTSETRSNVMESLQ
jgi:hypothetical protein